MPRGGRTPDLGEARVNHLKISGEPLPVVVLTPAPAQTQDVEGGRVFSQLFTGRRSTSCAQGKGDEGGSAGGARPPPRGCAPPGQKKKSPTTQNTTAAKRAEACATSLV